MVKHGAESVQLEAIQEKGLWKLFFGMFRRVHIPWNWLILTLVMSLVSARLSIIFPDYQRRFFDGDFATKTVIIGILILMATAGFSIFYDLLDGYVRNLVAKLFRDSVLKKIFRLPASAFDSLNPKELISRTTVDTQDIGNFLATAMATLTGDVYRLVLNIMLVYSYHPHLALMQLIIVPLFILEKLIQGRIDYRYNYRLQLRISRLTAFLSDLLVNIPIIKIFTQEKKETKRGEELIDELNDTKLKIGYIGLAFILLDQVLLVGNRVFAVLYGAYLVQAGQLDIGSWIAYFMLVVMLFYTMNSIVNQWSVLKGIQGAAARVAYIMDQEEESLEGEALEAIKEDIVFDQVSIAIEDKTILEDLSLVIKPGDKISLVGPSGAGKTTLLNSLEGFLLPCEGEIRLGDKPLGDYAIRDYRRRIAYVPQEVPIFAASLRDNLLYGVDREVRDDDLVQVLEKAALGNYYRGLKEGLDTAIQENGENLSGGERQRIAIARAMLKESDLILLDEATASLDALSEQEVLAAIGELAEDKTLVMVTHNLSLAKKADKILFLKEGRLLGRGSYEELNQSSADFRELVRQGV